MVEFTDKGFHYHGRIGPAFISWEEIDKERNKIRFANHVLVSLVQPYGRQDYVDVFIIHQDKWKEAKAKLLKAKEVYIGEIAGKHSQVIFHAHNIKDEETDLDKISEFYARSGWGQWDMNVLECLEEYLEANPEED